MLFNLKTIDSIKVIFLLYLILHSNCDLLINDISKRTTFHIVNEKGNVLKEKYIFKPDNFALVYRSDKHENNSENCFLNLNYNFEEPLRLVKKTNLKDFNKVVKNDLYFIAKSPTRIIKRLYTELKLKKCEELKTYQVKGMKNILEKINQMKIEPQVKNHMLHSISGVVIDMVNLDLDNYSMEEIVNIYSGENEKINKLLEKALTINEFNFDLSEFVTLKQDHIDKIKEIKLSILSKISKQCKQNEPKNGKLIFPNLIVLGRQ